MASSLPFPTAEMVRALIGESRTAPRYETVYGELLVAPAHGPWHQELVGRADRFTERKLYQDRGTETYWMVDPEERLVEVWTPDGVFPRTEHETLRWQPTDASTEFVLELHDLFAPL